MTESTTLSNHKCTLPADQSKIGWIITSSGNTLHNFQSSASSSGTSAGIISHAYVSIIVYDKKYIYLNKYFIYSVFKQTARQYLFIYFFHNTVCTLIWLNLQEEIKHKSRWNGFNFSSLVLSPLGNLIITSGSHWNTRGCRYLTWCTVMEDQI